MSNTTLSTKQSVKASPAVMAFEHELENILLRFTKKSNSTDSCYTISENAGKRKVNFSKLFKEYKPRLQHHYFVEKLMQIGSFLYSVKAFKMAKFQCFVRYLSEISPDFTCIESVAGYCFKTYKDMFFPKGLEDVLTIDTIRVLYEDAMCSYQLLIEYDPRLQNSPSVVRCEELLKILRLTTQLALHKESFSWLVYNGTVHIYTISRQLMVTGHSALVLEHLLWTCVCMEASIPLLTLKYMPWRSTLYAAVSLCYLDCKQLQQAETFARRAMKKINELSDIEEMSTSVSTPETKAIFQSAKVKINAIIFQRVVFELRKRPKGLLRPKQRPNLKEALHQTWPRSQTERLLADLMKGSAAQFLAILQTLGDPHRRTLQCKTPTGAIDDITLDIFPELFVAGVDLLSLGNTGTRGSRHEPEVHASCIQLSSLSLLSLSEQGSDGVPLPFVVKFIKLSFNYEQWDVLDALLQPFIMMLKTGPDLIEVPAYIVALELLAAMEHFCNTGRKQKKGLSHSDNVVLHENTQGSKSNSLTVDDLLVIANVLSGSSELPQSSLPYIDVDMMVDAALFLWTRCKPYFQRVVSCNLDSCRQIVNDADCDKWLCLLLTIHNVFHWSGLSDVDPLMTGEVALKLALVLECRAASLSSVSKATSAPGLVDTKEQSCDEQQRNLEEQEKNPDGVNNKPYQLAFPNTAVELLHMAFQVLEAGVERVGEARDKLEGSLQENEAAKSDKINSSIDSAETEEDVGQLQSTETAVEVIHLELLFNLTRLLVKLDTHDKDANVTSDTERVGNSMKFVRRPTKKDAPIEESWTADVMKKYNKRSLTKALLLMHKTHIENPSPKVAKQQLQECFDLIKKSQTQEKVLISKRKTPVDHDPSSSVPPPPILVFRSSSQIILKPAPYKPLTKQKVCWYCVFGCSASGSNVKVRLNDSDLTGAGEEIPQGPDCKFFISNLNEGERYVFAVAAYDENGNLIGGGIGPTSHAIPACHPMPVIMAWGYLTQVAYNCSIHDVAKSSAQVLWRHFVSDQENTSEEFDEQLPSIHDQSKLKISRCDDNRLANCNKAFLRQFLQSIFISVNISVQDGKLYCDSFCDCGPLLPGQVNRIKQCEKMLLGLQVALWLNDNTLVLQIVTRCYGLLAPLLQLKIPAKPVVQVLLQCYAVLQEVPSLSRYRKHSVTSDSLYHLIAVVTYYLTKVLPLMGEQDLANAIRESGRKLLSVDQPDTAPLVTTSQLNDEQTAGGNLNAKPTNKKTAKAKKGGKKSKGGAGGKSNVKPEQSKKAGSFQKKEFLSLESYYLKSNIDAILTPKIDGELTGAEDPSILGNYVAGLNAQDAYKEVIKFKRRTKYLEYFVQVLEKAFVEGCLQKVLDWSNDTEHWLYKRNELLMPVQKTSLVRTGTEHGTDDSKPKKFATGIVEYGKPVTKKSPKTTRPHCDSISEGKAGSGKGETSQKAPQPFTRLLKKEKVRKKGKTAEEIDMLVAFETMQHNLPDFWKTEQRKKKLRTITNEEISWRCQWNILRGVASLEKLLKNTMTKTDTSNPADSIAQDRAPLMGVDWFGFDVSGVLIPRQTGDEKDAVFPLKSFIASSLQDGSKASPRRKRELSKTDDISDYIAQVYNAAKYLSRAVVLSSRGKCRGLLQNASCHLWNLRQKLQPLVTDPTYFLSEEMLQEITWLPFYHTANSLLDMVLCVQEDKTETLLSRNKSSLSSSCLPKGVTFWGDIEDEKGGSDLIFEDHLDDQSDIDAVWIKRVVMHAMELLFYQNKWEKLADIILRFNALSRGRYVESILPLLAVAQQKLHERAQEHGGVSTNQPDVAVSCETGKPEGLTITANISTSFPPAVHIDPKGHDVYNDDNNALRLFCVPIDKTQTLQMLKQSMEIKHCAARALQHSRQLLLRYLAGLSQQKRSASRVGFATFEDQAVTCLPPDLSEQTFNKINDVQKCPLASSQLAVVITSYDKTIEMLQFHGRKALLAQAMNEIGNIMLHIGNTRSAFRWWQSVLDSILSPVLSSKAHQPSHNPYHDAAHVSPSMLLKKRGIWGCLLGAITAVNIARYIHTDDTDKRLDYCCVAASLLKALFSASLPHPIANFDFALYDIGNGYPVGSLIPGVNLFSDVFRCDPKVLLTSIVWLVEELIESRHYLLVLPLLSLARYIASEIFDNETWTTRVLLLRVRALSNAGLFSQSYIALNSLLVGRNPKRPMKSQMTKTQLQNTEMFHCDSPVAHTNNIQALTNLIFLRLSPDIATTHGTKHSRDLALEQARLMIAIASAVYAAPVDVKQQLMEKLAAEIGLDTSTSEYSKASKPYQIFLFEDDASETVVKSYLLAGAELILEELRGDLLGSQKDLRDYLDVKGQDFKPSEFKMLILIELELASIREQHLESLNAAQIVYACMRALEDASVILEHDQKRFSSAWTVFSRSSDLNKTPELMRDELKAVKTEFDSHLWLACRIKMAHCLSCEENSIGRIAGFSRSVVALTGSCEQHCEQGVEEAEAFNNTEILAEFQVMAMLLRLQHGRFSHADFEEFKSVIEVLRRFHPLSIKGRILLVKMLIYYGDFIISFGDSEVEYNSDYYYEQAESILREEMKEFGENLEYCAKETSISIQNIHLPHIHLLAEIKLRQGRELTLKIDDSGDTKSINEALDVLNRGLTFTTTMNTEQNPLESEFLYLIGKLQHLLWLNEQCSEMVVASSFINAIKKTFDFDHNLELMKECYEQLALFYITKTQKLKREVSEEEAKSSCSNVSPSKVTRNTSKLSRKDKESKEKRQELEMKAKREIKKELKAAWVAIRSAATITAVLKKRALLIGDVTELSISKETGAKIPKSAIHDVLGAVSSIVNSEDESCVQDDGVIIMASYIYGLNSVQLTWVHLLSHVSYLQRQVSYQSLGVETVGYSGPLFRWQKLLKLSQMRHLLSTELDFYVKTCSGVYPSSLLLLADGNERKSNDYENYTVKNVGEAEEYEVSIEWLSTATFSKETSSNVTEPEDMQCLYAFNNKTVSGNTKSGVFAGTTSVSYKTIMEIREQLQKLVELADLTPQPTTKPSKPDVSPNQQTSLTSQTSRKKRKLSMKILSARGPSDDQIQVNLKECLYALTKMMKPSLLSDKKDVPFEISHRNILALESIFDPTCGFIGKISESFYTWLSSLFL